MGGGIRVGMRVINWVAEMFYGFKPHDEHVLNMRFLKENRNYFFRAEP